MKISKKGNLLKKFIKVLQKIVTVKELVSSILMFLNSLHWSDLTGGWVGREALKMIIISVTLNPVT
jgi:hypothetical protein